MIDAVEIAKATEELHEQAKELQRRKDRQKSIEDSLSDLLNELVEKNGDKANARRKYRELRALVRSGDATEEQKTEFKEARKKFRELREEVSEIKEEIADLRSSIDTYDFLIEVQTRRLMTYHYDLLAAWGIFPPVEYWKFFE